MQLQHSQLHTAVPLQQLTHSNATTHSTAATTVNYTQQCHYSTVNYTQHCHHNSLQHTAVPPQGSSLHRALLLQHRQHTNCNSEQPTAAVWSTILNQHCRTTQSLQQHSQQWIVNWDRFSFLTKYYLSPILSQNCVCNQLESYLYSQPSPSSILIQVNFFYNPVKNGTYHYASRQHIIPSIHNNHTYWSLRHLFPFYGHPEGNTRKFHHHLSAASMPAVHTYGDSGTWRSPSWKGSAGSRRLLSAPARTCRGGSRSSHPCRTPVRQQCTLRVSLTIITGAHGINIPQTRTRIINIVHVCTQKTRRANTHRLRWLVPKIGK